MATKIDSRQVVLRTQSPFIGNAANEQLDVVFPRIDAEMAKLYEDRNVMLQNGGIITFTGTQIQFTEDLEIVLNQKISGAAPQVINLGSVNVDLANGEMWYAVIDRTAGTATTSVASTLPAVVAANQEVFLIVKRVDAGDGTQRIYWRSGMAMNAGQSNRLGASGSGGSGSGIGDDLNALLFRASFTDDFSEGPTSSVSAVDASANMTDPLTYSAAKSMYVLAYDADHTIAAGTTATNINLDSVTDFTVKIGDVVVYGGEARRITAVASQQSFTTEAFSVAPALSAQVTVSQAVYSKDIYNIPVDGNPLSDAFPGEDFVEILVDYEDTTAPGDDVFDVATAPVIGFAASNDGSNFTSVAVRPTMPMDVIDSTMLLSMGSALYLRFFSVETSGSGTVNLLRYKAFMQKNVPETAGGITNTAYGFTNNVGTPVNCSITVESGKTVVNLDWQYAVGVYPGSTASSIEVWLNGQKLPRFIDSVNTPDGSFVETSNQKITLDRNYSFQNFSIEIFQRISVVDTSTTNTTEIANIQSHKFTNLLINSNFNFWQRGTSVTVANTATTYLADRWYVRNALGTNGVITYSRENAGLIGSAFGARVQITTAPTAAQANGTELIQVLENQNTLQMLGKAISFGCNIKALGNVTQVGIQLMYATSETKPILVLGVEQIVNVNTANFVLGQILAQNVGSLPTNSGVVGVRIRIMTVSSGNTYDLSNGFIVEQAQMNIGFAVASYQMAGRNIQEELAMCQRYYEKSYSVDTSPGTFPTYVASKNGRLTQAIGSGNDWGIGEVRYRVQKRSSPTITIYNPENGGIGSIRNTDAAADYSTSVSVVSDSGFAIARSGGSVGALGNFVAGHWTADSEI